MTRSHLSRFAVCAASLLALACVSPARAQAPADAQAPAVAIASAASTPQTAMPPASNYAAVGQFYFGRGDFQKAALAYGIAAERNPTSSEALLGLGRSRIRLGQAAEAAEVLSRLTALDPRNISGQVALSQAYSLAWRQGEARGKANPAMLRSAYAVLERGEAALGGVRAHERNVQRSKLVNERGYLLRLEGRTEAAAQAFAEAHALNPREGTILLNLAETQAALGQREAARDSARRAVLASPRSAAARAYFARLQAEAGNFAVALPQAARAAELAPRSAYAAAQAGAVAYLAHQPEQARRELTRALELDAEAFGPHWYFLGRLELDAANLAAARAAFAEATAAEPHSAAAHFYLGLSLERSAADAPPRHAEARAAYAQALALAPAYAEARAGYERLLVQ